MFLVLHSELSAYAYSAICEEIGQYLLPVYCVLVYNYTELCLGALLNQLHTVRASWYNIGLQLGIPYSTLDCFKQMYFDPSDLMCEMLKHWLRTAVKPRPSWEAVVTALRSSLVNENYLADKLESKYIVHQCSL